MKSITQVVQNLLKPYIDNKDKAYAANIAPVEASPATATHTAGTQLIYEGVLYDVTEDIAVNDPLATTGAGANIKASKNVSTQLNEIIDERLVNGVKNILPFIGSFIGKTTATSANDGTLGTIHLNQGDEIVFTCMQDSDLTSNTRNTLVIEVPNTTPDNYIYEDGAVTTDYHNAAGLHIIRYTATVTGDYTFDMWTHTLSSAITYSQFMVCSAEDYDRDSSYQPYAQPNSDLTTELLGEIKTRTELGTHNLLDIRLSHLHSINTDGTWSSNNVFVKNGITFTFETDGDFVTSVDINGTASSEATFALERYHLSSGEGAADPNIGREVILSGCKGGSENTYYLGFFRYNGTDTAMSLNGDSEAFTPEYVSSGSKNIFIYVHNGYTANHIKIYPMIRLESDSNSNYAPYAMSNRELTEVVTGKYVMMGYNDNYVNADGTKTVRNLIIQSLTEIVNSAPADCDYIQIISAEINGVYLDPYVTLQAKNSNVFVSGVTLAMSSSDATLFWISVNKTQSSSGGYFEKYSVSSNTRTAILDDVASNRVHILAYYYKVI